METMSGKKAVYRSIRCKNGVVDLGKAGNVLDLNFPDDYTAINKKHLVILTRQMNVFYALHCMHGFRGKNVAKTGFQSEQ